MFYAYETEIGIHTSSQLISMRIPSPFFGMLKRRNLNQYDIHKQVRKSLNIKNLPYH
jgi:hypothetical protein